MKQFLWIALLVVTSVTGVRTAAAQAAGETPTPDSLRIDRFMRLNDQGDFTGALGMLPPSLQGKVTTEMLSRVWTRATYSIGSYRRIVRIREDIRDTLRVAQARCAFDRGFLTMNFVVNPDSQFIGVHVVSIDSVQAPSAVAGGLLIPVPGGRIGATLTVPPGRGKVPVALIIPGSGPVDRDGNEKGQVYTDSYRMLADSLRARGIASLRYDKRFVGASADFTSSAEHVRIEDFVSDAGALMKYLKKDRRFSRLVVIGHSEGSLVGMLASEQVHPDAFISLSGGGEPLDKIMEWQYARQPEMTLELQGKLTMLLDSIRQDRIVHDVPGPLQGLFNPGVQRYLMSELKYDPSWEIAKLHVPVLIIGGTRDLQITAQQAEKLHAAKPDAEMVMIPGMNHILKDAPEDRNKNMETYTEPKLPLDATLVATIAKFIGQLP
jgi:pimeloyl-ACP methyl ester carboxylesterase